MDDESDFSFQEIVDRNNQLMYTLCTKKGQQKINIDYKFQSEVVTYEFNDIWVLMWDVPVENMELSEEFKIIKNFDVKLVYDKSWNQESDFKARIFFELERIEFCVDKYQLSKIIDFSQTVTEDIDRISSLILDSNNIDYEEGRKNSTYSDFQANESGTKALRDLSYQNTPLRKIPNIIKFENINR